MSDKKDATEDATALNEDTKQLTGSSKRKRKSSIIKHNVLQNDQSSEGDTSPKQVRTYTKKNKTDRCKAEKEKSQTDLGDLSCSSTMNEDMKNDKDPYDGINNEESTSVTAENINEETNMKSVDLDEDAGMTKQRRKSKSSNSIPENVQCSGKAQQCQNCTFCSEHKQGSDDDDIKVDYVSKMYTCKICADIGLKRVYSSAEKYKKHTKEVHEPKKELKRFECTDCPEPVWFPTKSKYCYHLGAKHPGVIKFVCEICTQTFKLKANYRNHIKSHNLMVQKKFSCDVCGGTFVNRAGYEAHKKRFPGPHIKQSCGHCGISFSKEKHMKNHRCKILLLEEAAAARDLNKNSATDKEKVVEEQTVKESKSKPEIQMIESVVSDKKTDKECTSEGELDVNNKKQTSEGDQSGKRVLFHRLLPKKNEKLIYKQFPLQTQNVPQSVVVQEFREIDLDGGAFITAEPDHQIILRDVNGHLVQGNQILHLDINDFQPGEESQVYLTDWNVVAPFVIRGKSP